MRVLIVGSEITVKRLNRYLNNEEIELVNPYEVLEVKTALKKERFDLVVVDGLLKHADTACRNIKGLCRAPVVLLVDSSQADWKKLQSLGIDGYISRGSKGKELAVRLQAIARRYAINGTGAAESSALLKEGQETNTITQPKGESQ